MAEYRVGLTKLMRYTSGKVKFHVTVTVPDEVLYVYGIVVTFADLAIAWFCRMAVSRACVTGKLKMGVVVMLMAFISIHNGLPST